MFGLPGYVGLRIGGVCTVHTHRYLLSHCQCAPLLPINPRYFVSIHPHRFQPFLCLLINSPRPISITQYRVHFGPSAAARCGLQPPIARRPTPDALTLPEDRYSLRYVERSKEIELGKENVCACVLTPPSVFIRRCCGGGCREEERIDFEEAPLAPVISHFKCASQRPSPQFTHHSPDSGEQTE